MVRFRNMNLIDGIFPEVQDAKDIGTLEPGKFADLVVLEANPLEDIRNTGRVRAVYKGGRLV